MADKIALEIEVDDTDQQIALWPISRCQPCDPQRKRASDLLAPRRIDDPVCGKFPSSPRKIAAPSRFSFTTGELHLSATSGEIGEGKVKMPVNYAGEKLEIAFNPDLLSRYFAP